jgi:hypothetical protein
MTSYVTLQDATYVKEVITAYTELNDSTYTEVYDFGVNDLGRAKTTRIGFKNTMDVDVVIKFGSLNNQNNIHTIDAGDSEVLDNFMMIGVLEAKLTDTATEGRLKVWSW